MYEIGFIVAKYNSGKGKIAIVSLLLAPIMMPIELGVSVFCLLEKRL